MGIEIPTRQRIGGYEVRTEWWLDHTNLAALYRWLVDQCELDASDATAVEYFLSKPWKWTREWNHMHGILPANDVQEGM